MPHGKFIWFANGGGGELVFVLLSVVMVGVIYLSNIVCECVCVCIYLYASFDEHIVFGLLFCGV